jgi:hypothetical protein
MACLDGVFVGLSGTTLSAVGVVFVEGDKVNSSALRWSWNSVFHGKS